MLASWKKSLTNLGSILKSRDITLPKKGLYSQSYSFSSSHVWMWELDHKEGWAPKNLCFWTVLLEKTVESPLDCKEIQPVNPKGNKSWIFIGRTDAEVETPVLWPPDAKNCLMGKEPEAGKDWGQEEKRVTEDEMVGWHHQLNGHEFEQTPGDSEGQGSLSCYSPWGCKQLDKTEQQNNNHHYSLRRVSNWFPTLRQVCIKVGRQQPRGLLKPSWQMGTQVTNFRRSVDEHSLTAFKSREMG